MTLPLLAPMAIEDLDDIMPLEREVFADAWTRRMYLSDITSNPMATYRVLHPPPGAPAGAATMAHPPVLAWGGFWLMVDEAHIATIASHPAYRGCGFGQFLLLALMETALKRGAQVATLEVRAGNDSAQGLYRKLGYEIAGRRRRYYRDGEDGLIMTLYDLPAASVQERLGGLRVEAEARVQACLDGPRRLDAAGSTELPVDS